jgi:hypothetical protein
MPRVHASKVARADLETLLDELGADLRYVYLESVTDGTWSRYSRALPFDSAQRGRAFGPNCDVQFQRDSDSVRLTVLADSTRTTSLVGPTLDLTSYDSEDVTYLLWGRYARASDAWIEPGFRQRWQYPVDGQPGRIGVRAIEYRERTSGALQHVRYIDLVPVEDAE